jgi:hypothetical protein
MFSLYILILMIIKVLLFDKEKKLQGTVLTIFLKKVEYLFMFLGPFKFFHFCGLCVHITFRNGLKFLFDANFCSLNALQR